jgi:hypothetical protein
MYSAQRLIFIVTVDACNIVRHNHHLNDGYTRVKMEAASLPVQTETTINGTQVKVILQQWTGAKL